MPDAVRLSRRIVLVVAAAGLAAGCAGVPDSGGVHLARAVSGGGGLDQQDVRVLPALPRPGMSPTALVRGFLRALVYTTADYGIARDYLAVPASWHPAAGLTTYRSSGLTVSRSSRNAVAVSVPRVGVVDGSGHYSPQPGTVSLRFSVARTAGGQWRITHLPAQVLLSTYDTSRVMQAATLYFFNADESRVVPVPLLVNAEQAGLATTLARALVAGPTAQHVSALTTAIPGGTTLLGNVPVDDNGVAEVDLPPAVRQLPVAQLRRLSAQLGWTLRQIAGVSAVRLLAAGTPLAAPGVPSLQPLPSWPQFAPNPAPAIRGVLWSRGTTTVTGLGLTEPGGFRDLTAVAPALSADGVWAAALQPGGDGERLMLGPASGPLQVRLTASTLTPPSFDDQGDAVVAVPGRDGSRVEAVSAQSRRLQVARLPHSIAVRGVSALAVSGDGGRIALVVGPPGAGSLWVGDLRTGRGQLRIVDVQRLVAADRAVSGVAWRSGSELATTVETGSGRRSVLLTSVDGYQHSVVARTGLTISPTEVAASPQQPLVVAGDGQIWRQVAGRWQELSTGQAPAFAG